MKLLLALAAAFMVAATLAYLRHGAREYAQPYREDPDGVQPFDPRTAATGLYAA